MSKSLKQFRLQIPSSMNINTYSTYEMSEHFVSNKKCVTLNTDHDVNLYV